MQAFNPYLTPQQQASQAAALQQQIGYLQSQLQGVQSAMQQPIQQLQTVQQQMANQIPTATSAPVNSGVVTRIVDSFDSITANDVPMDNNGAFFVKNDGSEVQLRNWTAQGTIQNISYKPVSPEQRNNNAETGISSTMTQKMEIGLSDEATQAFMQRFDELANRLDVMEQILNRPTPTKQTAPRSKKEADS